MFKNILDFSIKRNSKQAIGFYIAYFFLVIVLGAVAGALSTLFSTEDTLEVAATQTGAFVVIFYVLLITAVVLIKRKLYKNFWYIVLAVLSPGLAMLGGGLLGLLIPSFMTTRMNEVDSGNIHETVSGDPSVV